MTSAPSFRLLPVEATEAMIKAARVAHETERQEWTAIHYRDGWAAIRSEGVIREPSAGDDWVDKPSQAAAEDHIDQRAWQAALNAALAIAAGQLGEKESGDG